MQITIHITPGILYSYSHAGLNFLFIGGRGVGTSGVSE